MKLFYILSTFILTMPLFAKLMVVSTIPDYASMAEEIGGDKIKAISLIKGTQDPHFADAKPSLIVKMNKADLLILTGLGLESGWLPKLITNARNTKISIGNTGYLDASKYVNLIDADKQVDRSMGDVHVGGNPHFYNSPVQLYRVSKEIYNRLIQLDPENEAYYTKNWKAFSQKFENKLSEWKAKLKKVKNMELIEYHESWAYLLRWTEIKKIASLEPKPGISPSAKHVIRLLKKVKHKKIRFIIQEVYYPRKLSKLFAKKSGSELLILPSSVGSLKPITSIWDKFDYIVNQLTK